MYYQFTGQPGHGKTVLALEFALDMKAKADKAHAEDPAKHPFRQLYVCNVRDFNAGKAGAVEITPEQVKRWHDEPDFDHAIILVDEAYEHGMFPKRGPGAKVPEHVQQVAKHRHRGIDFVMICQSPTRQMDDFMHDLIEEHYHVRRRFGLPLVNLKRWDRFERNPDKAEPLTTTKRRYPTQIFKLYTSTKYDTSEKRVPWFYYAFGGLVVAIIAGIAWNWVNLSERFGKKDHAADAAGLINSAQASAPEANGAAATVAHGGGAHDTRTRGTIDDYLADFMPRIAAQPWTAPAYDAAPLAPHPPRLFCMKSGMGEGADGEVRGASCRCMTDQGTRYALDWETCITVAENGQYEPYLQPAQRQETAAAARPPETAAPDSLAGSVVEGNPAAVTGAGIRLGAGVQPYGGGLQP